MASTISKARKVQYDKFWDGSARPNWDLEKVTITAEAFLPKRSLSGAREIPRGEMEHPTLATAIVLPVTTTGRPSPPDPESGLALKAYAYDRGHLIGLELGGPDVSMNIAPQWAHFQRTQLWRKMERSVRDLALAVMGIKTVPAASSWAKMVTAPTYVVTIAVTLIYGREPMVPNKFRVVLKKLRMADLTFVQFGAEAVSANGALDITFELDNEPDPRDLRTTEKQEEKM